MWKCLFTLALIDYRFLEIIKSRQPEGIARARDKMIIRADK